MHFTIFSQFFFPAHQIDSLLFVGPQYRKILHARPTCTVYIDHTGPSTIMLIATIAARFLFFASRKRLYIGLATIRASYG